MPKDRKRLYRGGDAPPAHTMLKRRQCRAGAASAPLQTDYVLIVDQARPRYSPPSRVSILSTSPVSMNSGT